MNNSDEVLQAISIGLIVAGFLLNTSRGLKAIELCKECLFILKNKAGIKDDKLGKSFFTKIYFTMAEAYIHINDYTNAIKYGEKSLHICRKCGEKTEECWISIALAGMYLIQSKHLEAKELFAKALLISTEIGDKDGEAVCYIFLGDVFESDGEYEKARKHYEKLLAIKKEIGDKNGEAFCYRNLGSVYRSVGEYEKAREHLDQALAIYKETGDRNGEAFCCRFLGNLGNVYLSIGEYENAKEHFEKSLMISKKVGERQMVAWSYRSLGDVFNSLGRYSIANRHYQRGLFIAKEIGNRVLEASCYSSQAALFGSLFDFAKAKEYLEKALAINQEIEDRISESSNYLSLGRVLLHLSENVKAEECIKKGLAISEKIGDVPTEIESLETLAQVKKQEGKIQEAVSYFLPGIQKCEDLLSCLRDNDQFKISFSNRHIKSYQQLCALFCGAGNPDKALYVTELGRARALADLMSAQYSSEKQISANPETWSGIEKVMDNERNCTCLYVSYFFDSIFLWIVKANGVKHFRKIDGRELIFQEGLARNLDEFFASKSFRSFHILPKEHCEDRSLDCIHPQSKSCEEESLDGGLRIRKESEDNTGPKMNLPLCYQLIIAPVVDLLEGQEIIIVPDRSLYNIPFAALPDENGKCLAEAFRIRVAPSLTTLKLIQDSPADYHSQTGALIVGNPDVGHVQFKRRPTYISRLPCAENEAKMIGQKLGVKPLLGQEATKQAVLEVINSVSLIHFAAHGDAERGEIVLAPAIRTPDRRPREEEFLLTMSDISKVRLRAKLVVLSCCHSARGQIRAEGAVGIARAFLGSGARSVLVSLWALEDSATEQLMSRFYKHLVRGKSASESLHEAMKRMRCKGYSHVSEWAPFILIGDNVTFDFEKQGFLVAQEDQNIR
ncbi:tetratricopeptide repeat protein 28-like [Oculina patagonica]